jgi:hypothetical protein
MNRSETDMTKPDKDKPATIPEAIAQTEAFIAEQEEEMRLSLQRLMIEKAEDPSINTSATIRGIYIRFKDIKNLTEIVDYWKAIQK